MPNIKRGDFVKSVAQATGLSPQRAKQVARAAGVDLGYAGRTLSKEQEKRAVKALPQALKDLKMRVRGGGLSDERRFKQKFTKTMSEFKVEARDTGKKPLNSAVDFIKKVEQGIPGSKEAEAKRPVRTEIRPKIRAERVSLSDNSANIETLGHRSENSEPLSPNIG